MVLTESKDVISPVVMVLRPDVKYNILISIPVKWFMHRFMVDQCRQQDRCIPRKVRTTQ